MQRYIITVALVCALITFSSSSPTLTNTGPMLNLLTTTANEIEGEYYTDMTERNGIYFLSTTMEEDDSYFIQITTTNGEPILSIKGSHAPNSPSLVSILGRKVVIIANSSEDGSLKMVPHIVSTEYLEQVEEAFYQKSYEALSDLLSYIQEDLDMEDSLDTLAAKLLLRPEIDLIREAALAVESSITVETSESLAVLSFYDLSLRLKIAKKQLTKKTAAGQDDNSINKRSASFSGSIMHFH